MVEFAPGTPNPILDYVLDFLKDPVFDQSLEIVPLVATAALGQRKLFSPVRAPTLPPL